MKNLFYSLLVLCAIGLSFTQCKKDSTNAPLNATTVVVDASSNTKWAYFSFDKGDTVTVANPSTSKSWDIAFQTTSIKTNSAKTGLGQGGMLVTKDSAQAGFDTLKVVPAVANFSVDDTVSIQGPPAPGSNIPTVSKVVMNPLYHAWYTYNYATNTIIPTNKVIIFKTGNGNYAKVWIKSFYSATGVTGYLKLSYKYQNNGSKTLE